MNLEQFRWFASKGRGGRVSHTEILDAYCPGVYSEIVTVSYPSGEPEYYQLLCCGQPNVTGLADATMDPAAMAALMAALPKLASETRDWTVTLPLAGELANLGPAHRFEGEQSNTTVLFGQRVAVKVFRRVQPGRNVDIDMLDALTRAGSCDVPRLYGWVSGSFTLADGCPASADLMMISEQIPDATSGWELALASVACADDFSAEAAGLGAALARVHQGLAQVLPTGSTSGAELADRLTERILGAIASYPPLGAHREMLLAQLRGLPQHELTTQRIHGDFHLGQALHSDRGWTIIDFEGEPLRPLSQRYAPDLVWRDVAGLLRSLSYAAASTPDPTSPVVTQWLSRAQSGFLRGYCGGSLDREQESLLGAYLADKVSYEVVYEARNRPSWVAVPMAAIGTMRKG